MNLREQPTTLYIYKTIKTGKLLKKTGRVGIQEDDAVKALLGLRFYEDRGAVFLILLEGTDLDTRLIANLAVNPVPLIVIRADSITSVKGDTPNPSKP